MRMSRLNEAFDQLAKVNVVQSHSHDLIAD